MKNFFLLLIGSLFLVACGKTTTHSPKKTPSTAYAVLPRKTCEVLKKKPIKLEYKKIYADPQMKNLNMIGNVGRYGVDGDMGKILRILRYKNIADAAEARYSWIPKGVILAMMAQESGGADLLPNGNDDGGIGSIHMQGQTASDFGLDTYHDCSDMVCHKHGKELRGLIEKNNADKKQLVEYDDRFNPILNLDAVARMLTYYRCCKNISGYSGYQTAICRYSGSYNYHKYYRGVEKYRKLLQSKSYLKKVESKFNEMNPDFTVNGKKTNFKEYVEICQKQNMNYGLEAYKNLGEFKF